MRPDSCDSCGVEFSNPLHGSTLHSMVTGSNENASFGPVHTVAPNSRFERVVLIAPVLLLAVLYGSGLRNTIGPYGDDADYVALAEGLLEGTYRPLYLAEQPPISHRPPLYPLLLTPLSALFGRNYICFKALSVLAALAAVLFCYWRFRLAGREGRGRSWIACVALLPVALSPLTTEFSSAVMSEIPFLAVWTAFLYGVERLRCADDARTAKRLLIALTLLGLALIELRTIGLVLVVGAGLGLLCERTGGKERTKLGWLLLAEAVVLGSLWRWTMSFGGVDYLQVLQQPDIHQSTDSSLGVDYYCARVMHNLNYYLERLLSWTVGAPRATQLGTMGAAGVKLGAAALLGLALIGALRGWRAGRRAEAVAAALYAVVLSIWVTRSGRFVIPMLPLLALWVWQVADVALARIPSPDVRRRSAWAVCLALCLGTLTGAVDYLRTPNPLAYPSWRRYRNTATWIYGNTPRSSVIACRKPALLYLWSGRTVCWHPFERDPERALARLKELGATHLLRDEFRFTDTTRKFVDPLLASRPEAFRLLTMDEGTRLYLLE